MRVRSWEDPLEEGTATHSSILAWRIPWTEEPGSFQYLGCHKRVRHNLATRATNTFFLWFKIFKLCFCYSQKILQKYNYLAIFNEKQ